jgi:hypothetical protein
MRTVAHRLAFPAPSLREGDNDITELGQIRAAGLSAHASTSLGAKRSNPASFAMGKKAGLLRRFAPRNDGVGLFEN